MPTKIAATLLSALLICGCSTSATISRAHGGSLDAKILRSTSDTVVVQTEMGSEARAMSPANSSTVPDAPQASAFNFAPSSTRGGSSAVLAR